MKLRKIEKAAASVSGERTIHGRYDAWAIWWGRNAGRQNNSPSPSFSVNDKCQLAYCRGVASFVTARRHSMASPALAAGTKTWSWWNAATTLHGIPLTASAVETAAVRPTPSSAEYTMSVIWRMGCSIPRPTSDASGCDRMRDKPSASRNMHSDFGKSVAALGSSSAR
eukprot:6186593-Pleurochrysis_carterae.AAC.3